ncbi:MAG: hypothetical protein ACLP41_08710 [Acidimicrobiales bacterium]
MRAKLLRRILPIAGAGVMLAAMVAVMPAGATGASTRGTFTATPFSHAPAGRLSIVAGDGSQGPPTPGPATKSALDGPAGVALSAQGNMFIADRNNNVVEEVTRAGRLSIVAGDGSQGPPTPGPATKSALDAPQGVVLGRDGDLFIGDANNNLVEEVTRVGRLSVFAGVVGKSGPPTPGPATKSTLNDLSEVALNARGDLFIGDQNNNVVEEVTPAGMLSVFAGDGAEGPPTPGPATKSALNDPCCLAVDVHGDLFIADFGNNLVEEVTPAGMLSVVAGVVGKSGPPTPGPATKSALNSPGGVAVDAHGDLFIADYGNNIVEKVTF